MECQPSGLFLIQNCVLIEVHLPFLVLRGIDGLSLDTQDTDRQTQPPAIAPLSEYPQNECR